jgi:hypothetical protein
MFSTEDSRLYQWQHGRTARHNEPVSASGLVERLIDRTHRDHPHASHVVRRKL